MTVNIRWLDLNETEERSFIIPTSIEALIVYQTGNVITKTEWFIENSKTAVVTQGLSSQIQYFLNNPASSLSVNLLKQGSIYRNKVWSEIAKIPAGKVLSYSELARKIDSGPRAVANACRDNPFPGIIPCHRVVSVSGLGGYMGKTDGKCLEIKKKLLAIESNIQA